MRIQVVLVVLVMLLAGCSGGKGEPPATEGLVQVEPGLWVDADKGVLRGLVRNDASLPVEGARVQVLGVDATDQTDAKGRFELVNVTAGKQVLRVEASGFLAQEDPVVVGAGNVTAVDVYLVPDTSRGPGYSPHIHDRWAGRDSHVLFDGEVTYERRRGGGALSTLGSYDPVYMVRHPNQNGSDAKVWIPVPEQTEDGRANIVYPGTERVEVTVTWDETSTTLSEMGVAYEPNGGDLDFLAKKPPGSTWTISVRPDEPDNGHQMFTFWGFYLYPGNNAGSLDWEPGAVFGPFHVKIEIFRGGLYLEPEHPEFWQDGDVLRFQIKDTQNIRPNTYRHPFTHPSGHLGMPEDQLIPPGASRMRINFTYEYKDLDDELKDTPADMSMVLTWRTADQNPWTTPVSEYRGDDYADCGWHCRQYDFEIEESWTDAFYQQRSLWQFLVSVEGYEDEQRFSPEPRGEKTFVLDVTVWREP